MKYSFIVILIFINSNFIFSQQYILHDLGIKINTFNSKEECEREKREKDRKRQESFDQVNKMLDNVDAENGKTITGSTITAGVRLKKYQSTCRCVSLAEYNTIKTGEKYSPFLYNTELQKIFELVNQEWLERNVPEIARYRTNFEELTEYEVPSPPVVDNRVTIETRANELSEDIEYEQEIEDIPKICIGYYQEKPVYKKGDTIITTINDNKYLLSQQSVDEDFSFLINERIPEGSFIVTTDLQGKKNPIGYITVQGRIPNLSLYGEIEKYAKNSTGHKFYQKLFSIGQYRTNPVYLRVGNEIIGDTRLFINDAQYILPKQKKSSELEEFKGLPQGEDIRIICWKEGNQTYSLNDIVGYVLKTEEDYFFKEINRGVCSEWSFQKDLEKLNRFAIVQPLSIEINDLVELVNTACEESLSEHLEKYPFDIFKNISQQNIIGEKSEQAILRIIKHIEQKDSLTYVFLEKLYANNATLYHLIKKIDDYSVNLFDGNNYSSFVETLLRMYAKCQHFWEPKIIMDQEDSRFWGQYLYLDAKIGDFKHKGIIDKESKRVKIFVERLRLDVGLQPYSGTSKESESICELSLLAPVFIIPAKSNISVVQTAIDGAVVYDKNGEICVVPAFFLDFIEDKEFVDIIKKQGLLTFDVISFFSGIGSLLKAATWGPRIWAMIEVAGAIGNTIKDIDVVKPEDNLYDYIELYNEAMLLIGLTKGGVSISRKGHDYYKKLPPSSQLALKEGKSLSPQLESYYVNANASLKNKKLSKKELENLKKCEENWNLLRTSSNDKIKIDNFVSWANKNGLSNLSKDNLNDILILVDDEIGFAQRLALATKEIQEASNLSELSVKLRLSLIPEYRSLTLYEARVWYSWRKAKIKDLLDKTKPLEQQAKQAFNMRNEIRMNARNAMKDADIAEFLNTKEINMTWEAVYSHYRGDYNKIIEGSMKGRSDVDQFFKIPIN